MSQLGQKRTNRRGPKSTVVRYCPKATIQGWMSDASTLLPTIEITSPATNQGTARPHLGHSTCSMSSLPTKSPSMIAPSRGTTPARR